MSSFTIAIEIGMNKVIKAPGPKLRTTISSSPPCHHPDPPPLDTTNTTATTIPPLAPLHRHSLRVPPAASLPSSHLFTPLISRRNTTAAAATLPAAAFAVAGCGWLMGHHRRGGAYKTS
nr:hypothetical protein [Tanacetum cinerariifolium]